MRILLLTAPWSYTELYPSTHGLLRPFTWLREACLRLVMGIQPPWGILYIASVLRAGGHSVFFLDGYFNSSEDVLTCVEKRRPQLIGFMCTSPTWQKTRQMVRDIKRQFPSIFFVVGGAHPNSHRELCLRECEELDAVICGSGEHTLLELCNALERGESLGRIAGLIWRDGKQVVTNRPRPTPPNLDSIPPPDRSLLRRRYLPSLRFYKRLPHTQICTSRGCSRRCIFCSVRERIRLRSSTNVTKEVEDVVKRLGVRDMTFYDDQFMRSSTRVQKICDTLLRKRLDVTWATYGMPDKADEELLRKMKEAGCFRLVYTLGSGVEKNLRTLRLGFTLDQARRAIRLTRRAGIETFGTFMFGIPGETFEEGLRTIDFACSLGLDYAAFININYVKGSELYENVKKFGRSRKLTAGLGQHLVSHFVPYSMREEHLSMLIRIAYKRFYLRLPYLMERAVCLLKQNPINFFNYLVRMLKPGLRVSSWSKK